jgi:hypothetical protein
MARGRVYSPQAPPANAQTYFSLGRAQRVAPQAARRGRWVSWGNPQGCPAYPRATGGPRANEVGPVMSGPGLVGFRPVTEQVPADGPSKVREWREVNQVVHKHLRLGRGITSPHLRIAMRLLSSRHDFFPSRAISENALEVRSRRYQVDGNSIGVGRRFETLFDEAFAPQKQERFSVFLCGELPLKRPHTIRKCLRHVQTHAQQGFQRLLAKKRTEKC